MGLNDRASQSIGGPRGGSAWLDNGDSFTLAQAGANGHTSFTVTTTLPGLIPAQTVTRPNTFVGINPSTAVTYYDVLDATQIIQNLYGFQVTSAVVMPASTILTITMSVYRTVGAQSGAGGSGTTSVTLKAPLTQAIPNASTLTITKVDGSASTTLTTNAAAQAGATTISVSGTPNLTGYADGSLISWQVGNGPAFGWQGNVAQQGLTGTPAFPAGVSILAPIVAANTSLVTTGVNAWGGVAGTVQPAAGAGFIPVQAGDLLALNVVTSSSTVTCQVLNIQPLMS